MLSIARKTEVTEKSSTQYSRLQKLLAFRFFEKSTGTPEITEPADDFIDIVLEADFSNSGKVKNLK